ncbi:MAG: hypothetical protein Q4C03_06735, partial [bacterium]|nr:hypothetical protein [bacterium]
MPKTQPVFLSTSTAYQSILLVPTIAIWATTGTSPTKSANPKQKNRPLSGPVNYLFAFLSFLVCLFVGL